MTMTTSDALVKLFDELLQGHDIPSASEVCRISKPRAFESIDPLPYTFATNLRHAVLWQNFWLQRMRAGRNSPGMTEWNNDFREPDPREFESLRSEFIAGLEECRSIAAGKIDLPESVSQEALVRDLILIAVHGAYHLGQMNLIKRTVAKKHRQEK